MSPEWGVGGNFEVPRALPLTPLTLQRLLQRPPSSPGSPQLRQSLQRSEGGDFPRPPATSGRVDAEQPRRDGRGDAKVTREPRAGRRGAPARINSPSARPPPLERRPIPREIRLLGLLWLEERAPTRESLRERTGSSSSATRSGRARGSGSHTAASPAGPPPPPARPGRLPSRPSRSLPKAGGAWHPRPRDGSPSESRRE